MTRPRRHASLLPDHLHLIRIGPSQAAALTRLFARSAGTDTARQFDPFPLNEQTAKMIANGHTQTCTSPANRTAS